MANGQKKTLKMRGTGIEAGIFNHEIIEPHERRRGTHNRKERIEPKEKAGTGINTECEQEQTEATERRISTAKYANYAKGKRRRKAGWGNF